MKEIRLCDDCNLKETVQICKKYNLGIEIQSFYDIPKLLQEVPEMIIDHKELLRDINGGISMHGPFKSYEIGHDDPEIIEIIKNCSNSIWALECGTQYFEKSVEYLKRNNYIKSIKMEGI